MSPGDIIEWHSPSCAEGVHKWRIVGIHLGGTHRSGRPTESLVELESITHEPGWTGEFEYHPRLWVPEVLLRGLKITAGTTTDTSLTDRSAT